MLSTVAGLTGREARREARREEWVEKREREERAVVRRAVGVLGGKVSAAGCGGYGERRRCEGDGGRERDEGDERRGRR